MKKAFVTIAVITSTLLFFSCEKNKQEPPGVTYQLTTKNHSTTINLRSNPQTVGARQAGQTIMWTGGSGTVSEIKFEAKGTENVEYKSKVTQVVDLFNSLSTLGVVSVPAGNYEKVEFDVRFEPTSTLPAFELSGTFINSAGTSTPIVLRINSPVDFKFEKKTPTTIGTTSNYTAVNSLDFNILVAGITETMLNNAAKNTSGGITISSTSNTNIYNLILSAVSNALKVEIK